METLIPVDQAFKRYKPLALYYHPEKDLYYHARMVLDLGTVFDRYNANGDMMDHLLINYKDDSQKLIFKSDAPKSLLNLMKMGTNIESLRQDIKRVNATVVALQKRKDDYTEMLIDKEKAFEENKSNAKKH